MSTRNEMTVTDRKPLESQRLRAQQHDVGRHQSRREIDLAIGVLMGSRHWSADYAWAAILEAVKASGVGPGGVSCALLDVVSGEAEHNADPATAHWKVVLGQHR